MSQPAKPKQRFAAISSEEVEAAKKPIVVKNTEVYSVGCSRVHVVSRGAKRAWRQEMPRPIKDCATSWFARKIFVKEASRDDGRTYTYTPRNPTYLLSGRQRFINSKREPTEPLVKIQGSYIKWSVPGTTERSVI